MAMMTCGARRSPHSGETAVSSCTAMPSVNQRGTWELVSVRVNTWLISCHSVEAQWKLPGGRPEGLSMAMKSRKWPLKVTPSAPSPGMPRVRTAKSSWSG